MIMTKDEAEQRLSQLVPGIAFEQLCSWYLDEISGDLDNQRFFRVLKDNGKYIEFLSIMKQYHDTNKLFDSL